MCLDANPEKRQFMLTAANHSMTDGDYVYIYLDVNTYGFGKYIYSNIFIKLLLKVLTFDRNFEHINTKSGYVIWRK